MQTLNDPQLYSLLVILHMLVLFNNVSLLFSMEKVITFINKEIIVQQYTLFRIGNTYITSNCNSSMKMIIFLLYMYTEKFLSSPFDQKKPSMWNKHGHAQKNLTK